jgi:heme oxygenase (biliverdin-IX-beta and delta-forming)
MNSQVPSSSVESVGPGVIEALRDATRSRHAQLGASPAMSRLFDGAYTIPEYRSHLGRLLGLFEPLGRAVARAAHPADPIRTLDRSGALREDLAIMGATASEIDALERCRWLPPIEAAGLYGYAYVILGSMMGGKIIVKRLRTILGSAASFHFYGDGNGRSESLWASFCSDLEKNGKDDKEAICATAVGIFDAYASWLSEPILQKANR